MQLHMNRGGSSRGINMIDTGILRIAPVAIAKRIRSGNLSFMMFSILYLGLGLKGVIMLLAMLCLIYYSPISLL